jgi:methyl-accepting chemotaxis protein
MEKKMKIKVKLSLIVIAIVAVVVTTVAVILLRQASDISRKLSTDKISYLADEQAAYWEGRENRYMEVIRTVAAAMSDYEDTPAAERQDRYDDLLLSAMKSQPNFIRIASIWKPNALDGMDAHYRGRTGSTATGQYTMTWGKDTGQLIATHNQAIEDNMAWLNGPNAHKERVEHPSSLMYRRKKCLCSKIGSSRN